VTKKSSLTSNLDKGIKSKCPRHNWIIEGANINGAVINSTTGQIETTITYSERCSICKKPRIRVDNINNG
jgi:hypothetical protein